MNSKSILGVIIGITLLTTLAITTPMSKSAEGYIDPISNLKNEKAPPSIVGDNVYVVD